MELWESLYCIFMGFIIFNLLLLHTFQLIYADYVTILFLILLIFIPFLPKIAKIYYKGVEIELWNKEEIKEIKEETEKIMPEKKFEEIKEETDLERLINELVDIGEYDFYLGLVDVRLRLEKLVREIFISKISKKERGHRMIQWSLRKMSKKLLDKKIIDGITYDLLRKVINACNKAVHGFRINEENGELLYGTAIRLVAYFYNLNEKIDMQKR